MFVYDKIWRKRRSVLFPCNATFPYGFCGWIAAIALGYALSAATAYADPGRGGELFKEKKCVLCHDVSLPGTEFKPICPGLKEVSGRHGREWTRKWLENPAEVWKTNDADVQDINDRYFKFRGNTPKPRESFMATVIGKQVILSPEEIEHLLDYLWSL